MKVLFLRNVLLWSLVDKPSDYYTIVTFVDLFEYVFRPNEIQMMDQMVWKAGMFLLKQ